MKTNFLPTRLTPSWVFENWSCRHPTLCHRLRGKQRPLSISQSLFFFQILVNPLALLVGLKNQQQFLKICSLSYRCCCKTICWSLHEGLSIYFLQNLNKEALIEKTRCSKLFSVNKKLLVPGQTGHARAGLRFFCNCLRAWGLPP